MISRYYVHVVTPLALALCLSGRPAHADEGAPSDAATLRDERETQALVAFKNGRERMSRKQYEEACRAFEESQGLDPAVGTMLNLGYCYEQLGKTASAWATYREAASAAQDQGRHEWESAARGRVAKLESSLLCVVIDVRPQTDGDALTVLVDGTPLPKSAWGRAAPFYPGQHEVLARAADRHAWDTTFEVNAEHVPTVVVPALAPIASREVPEPMDRQTTPRAKTNPTRRTAALVLGSAGVVAVGITSILGLTAISTYHGADCVAGACTRAGVDAISRARAEGNVATVSVAVGASALVGATILWFAGTSPRGGIEIRAAIDGATWGLSLREAW